VTVREILLRVRQRLSDPLAWCQGSPRTADGRIVNCDDPAVASMCLCAHCDLAASSVYAGGHDAMKRLADCIAGGPLGAQYRPQIVSQWNDAPGRTHAHVLALIDRALKE
jgi:hypothetical protein